jgi:hypothetical protein
MPDGRENARIADKYQLDYYRQSRPARSWKWPAALGAIVLALAAAGLLYGLLGDRAFQAAPVAAVHASFGDNCQACHDRNWQPAVRLATADSGARSVSNDSCLDCHTTIGGHQGEQHDLPSCAACHLEHRPEHDLLAIADASCTSCHADLAEHGELPPSSSSSATFANSVTGFGAAGAHPDFALFRPAEAAAGHGVRQTAAWRGDEKTWRDAGGVKLNHKLHLEKPIPDAEGKLQQLACNDCHVQAADGDYMAPINYEAHCQYCHPMRLAAPLDTADIPHLPPDDVRKELRARLVRASTLPEAAAEGAPDDSGRKSLLPSPELTRRDQAAFIDAELEKADLAVFGPAAQGFCRKCHHVDADGADWKVHRYDPKIGDAQADAAAMPADESLVPTRWFQHAHFSHKKHETSIKKCQDCHAQADGSTATADVLLPSIAVCRICHGPEATNVAARTGDRCTLCHNYHDESHAAAAAPPGGEPPAEAPRTTADRRDPAPSAETQP